VTKTRESEYTEELNHFTSVRPSSVSHWWTLYVRHTASILHEGADQQIADVAADEPSVDRASQCF